LQLVAAREAAQQMLESSYPQVFVSDEEINRQKKERRRALNDDPAFRKVIAETAAAYGARKEYMHAHDELLGKLQKQLEASKD